jgi:prepilin peptidase CpaA
MWPSVTFYAFAISALVGGVIAIGMILWKGSWEKHKSQFWFILNEIVTVKDPEKLAEIAAERKPRMFLLPYGIPIAIGSIAYFAWHGMRL